MLAQIPTIIDHAPLEKITGGFIWGVTFKLPQPAAEDGYIVQKIRQESYGFNKMVAANPPPLYYYEAWEVKKGEVTPRLSRTISDFVQSEGNNALGGAKYNIPVNDIFYRKFAFGGEGSYLIEAWAGFYQNALNSNFIPGNKDTGAGQLLSTIYKPDFWSGQAFLYRKVHFKYNYTVTSDDLKSSHWFEGGSGKAETSDWRPVVDAIGLFTSQF